MWSRGQRGGVPRKGGPSAGDRVELDIVVLRGGGRVSRLGREELGSPHIGAMKCHSP